MDAPKLEFDAFLQELEELLGLQASLLSRLLRRGITWDAASRNALQALVTSLRVLNGKKTDEAKRQLASRLRYCVTLLMPDQPTGLFWQLKRSWLPARLSRESEERLQGLLRHFAQRAQTLERKVGHTERTKIPIQLLWPIKHAGKLWSHSIRQYNRVLIQFATRVETWSRKQVGAGVGEAAAFTVVVREFGEPPVPANLEQDARRAFLDLYEWHLKLVRELVRQLHFLQHASQLAKGLYALLGELSPPPMFAPIAKVSAELPIDAPVIETREVRAAVLVPGLISMADENSRWGGLAVRERGLETEDMPAYYLWYLASRCDDPRSLDRYAAVARSLQLWMAVPGSLGLTDRLREGKDTLCEMLGKEERDGAWAPRVRANSDHQSQRALDTVRKHLATLGLRFVTAEGVDAHFEDEHAANQLVRQEGLQRDVEGRRSAQWVAPKSHVSAGPRPRGLEAHLAQAGMQIPRLLSAAFWRLARMSGDRSAADTSLVRKVLTDIARQVFARDQQALSQASNLEEWERWLGRFIELINEAADRKVLAIDTAADMRKLKPTHWKWHGSPVGKDLSWERGIILFNQTTPRARKCSRGVSQAPLILAQVARAEVENESYSFQDPRNRIEIARRILDRGEDITSELQEALAVIGATIYPTIGARLDSRGPAATGDHAFDDQIAAGLVSGIRVYSVRWGDEYFPDRPISVRLSNGRAPELIASLTELDAKLGGRFGSRILSAVARYLHDDADSGKPILKIALAMVNAVGDSASGMEWRVRLAKEVSSLGGLIVPPPRVDRRYSWEELQRAEINRSAVFDADPVSEESSTQPVGEIARVESFACVYDKKELIQVGGGSDKVRWVRSLGPRSPELTLGEACVRELAPAGGYLNVRDKENHAIIIEELKKLSLGTYQKDPRAVADSVGHLVVLFADLDQVSDVIATGSVDDVRARVLAHLGTRGVRCEPAYARRGPAPQTEQRDVTFEVAGHDAGVQQVLARRITFAGEQPRGAIVCALGRVGTVQPESAEWQEILELYRALRGAYPGPAARFFDYFDCCRRYLANPDPAALVPLVAAGEMSGRDYLEIREHEGLRAAVEKIDRRIHDTLQFRRVDFRPGQQFRKDRGEGYHLQRVKIDGEESGLVVRTLNAAYRDASGEIAVPGLIQVTQ